MKIKEYREIVSKIKTKPYYKIGRLIECDKEAKLLFAESLGTPCEIELPSNVDIIFNWDDLDQFEEANMNIQWAKYRGRKTQTIPLGHSCAISIKYQHWNTLFDKIESNTSFLVSVGICEKSNWPIIRNLLQRLKDEGLDE